MKRVVVITSFLAVVLAAGSASAQVRSNMPHSAGGPIKVGNQCWAETHSGTGYGYWDKCDGSSTFPQALSRRGISTELRDGGGGGGGGGGSGR
jgi:hypothetical protein